MAKKKETLTDWANRAGISVSYAHELRSGKKQPDPVMAAVIYKRTGDKMGPLAVADTREANTVLKVFERAGLLAA